MLKEKGKDNYNIYKMVRASQFGVRFGEYIAKTLGDQKKLIVEIKENL